MPNVEMCSTLNILTFGQNKKKEEVKIHDPFANAYSATLQKAVDYIKDKVLKGL